MNELNKYESSRMSPYMLVALLLILYLILTDMVDGHLFVWQMCKMAAAGYMGHWLDYSLFPNSRPLVLDDQNSYERADLARNRKALIVAACILGMGFGA